MCFVQQHHPPLLTFVALDIWKNKYFMNISILCKLSHHVHSVFMYHLECNRWPPVFCAAFFRWSQPLLTPRQLSPVM